MQYGMLNAMFTVYNLLKVLLHTNLLLKQRYYQLRCSFVASERLSAGGCPPVPILAPAALL